VRIGKALQINLFV